MQVAAPALDNAEMLRGSGSFILLNAAAPWRGLEGQEHDRFQRQ